MCVVFLWLFATLLSHTSQLEATASTLKLYVSACVWVCRDNGVSAHLVQWITTQLHCWQTSVASRDSAPGRGATQVDMSQRLIKLHSTATQASDMLVCA